MPSLEIRVQDLEYRPVTREQWAHRMLDFPTKADRFAKTFHLKAMAYYFYQDRIIGAWWQGRLLGALGWTVTKREPKIANLQIIHVFSTYRGLGIGTALCQQFLQRILKSGAQYWRLSSERDAVPFYERLGVTWLGIQCGGCYATMGLIKPDERTGEVTFGSCWYSAGEPFIIKTMNRKSRGGLVEWFRPPDGGILIHPKQDTPKTKRKPPKPKKVT